MKRYFIFLLLIMVSSVGWFNVYGNAEIVNLLMLKSISFIDGKYVIEQELTVSTTSSYVLYVGADIIGSDNEYLISSDYDVYIYYDNHIDYSSLESINYGVKSFMSFTPTYSVIKKIEINTTNLSPIYQPVLMLFQGEINDFNGFTNYSDEISNPVGALDLVYLVPKGTNITKDEILSKISGNFGEKNLSAYSSYDNYTGNSNRYGTYQINVEIRDDSGTVYKKMIVKVKVVDHQKAEITGPDNITINRTTNYNINEILSYFVMTDNDPISQELRVASDGFDSMKIGEYEINIIGIDYWNNEVHKAVTINVIDVQKPKITRLADVIYTSSNAPKLTEAEILKKFIIEDDGPYEDLVITLEGYQEYLNSSNDPKDHQITVKVKDDANNETQNYIIVRVVKQEQLVINIDERFFLSLEASEQMTIDDIIKWFQDQLINENIKASNISLTHSEYNLSSKAGRYYLYFTYNTKDGIFHERMAVDVFENSKKLTALQISLIVVAAISIAGLSGYLIYKQVRKRQARAGI